MPGPRSRPPAQRRAPSPARAAGLPLPPHARGRRYVMPARRCIRTEHFTALSGSGRDQRGSTEGETMQDFPNTKTAPQGYVGPVRRAQAWADAATRTLIAQANASDRETARNAQV